MRILVDTNILINLEDNRVIDKLFSSFYKLAISNNCKIYYHPKAIPADIQRDKNVDRKNIILSKLEKYEKLIEPAELNDEFLKSFPVNKENDLCDNQQLFQLYKNYVDFFITQDIGIHKKAKRCEIESKCLNIEQAVRLLENNYKIVIPTHPIINHFSVRNIENLFESSFFDSFREDYGKELFSKWLDKCIAENRQCYCVKSESELVAVLIYNEEKVEEHRIPEIYEKVLKICTFKVSDSLFGLKIGELFLHKMLEYCINQKINYLYLTAYERQKHLIELLEKLGFYKQVFTNKQGLKELRLIKILNKSRLCISENLATSHPFYTDSKNVNKFVIPIQPRFYRTLFKDGNLRMPTLFDQFNDSINEIQGNSITKAYVSNSRQSNLKQGDILLFYASKTNQMIEPLGILESQQIVTEWENLWEIVRKKTVFSPDELKEMLNINGKLHVITFRLITYLKVPVRLKEIKTFDSFKNKLQTITRLKEQDYNLIKANGHFDERYIIN